MVLQKKEMLFPLQAMTVRIYGLGGPTFMLSDMQLVYPPYPALSGNACSAITEEGLTISVGDYQLGRGNNNVR